MGRIALTWLIVMALASACSTERVGDGAAEDDSTVARSPESTEPAPLAESAARMFGLPVPEVLELLEADDDTARYEADVDPLRLVAFYEDALPGYSVERWPDGVKFVADRAGRPDVYLLPADEGTEVQYHQAPIELPDIELAGAAVQDRTPRPPPLPRGVVAPEEVLARLRPDPVSGGRYYTGRIEQQGEEQVRVLTPRPQGSGGAPLSDQTDSPSSENLLRSPRSASGAYDRGDGQHSLRATRSVGPDGRVLPFFGDQRYEPQETTGY